MKKTGIAIWLMLIISLVFLQGCDNNEVGPKSQDVVKVYPAAEIGTFSASVSVTITTKGIFTVIEKGICWDTNSKPDVNDKKVIATATTGDFKFTLTLPEDNKDYYVRPYFKDDFGNVIYGNEITFKTLKDLTLSIVSQAPTDITEITATIATSISSTGVGTIASRGLVWGETENPVVGGSFQQETGSGPGDFSVDLKQLSPNRKYYARAYGTSNTGKTSYGNTVAFSTLPIQPFTVTLVTKDVPGASSTTANVSASITGTGNVADRGVCVNKTGNPTILDNKASAGKGTGEFTASLTGLTQGTIYYARAYATSNLGQTVYGNQVMFVTALGGASFSFSTKAVTNITNTTAVAGADLQGNGVVAMKGICWGTSTLPTVANNKIEAGAGFGSYNVTLTGLTTSTKYYVRPYAVSSGGTIYGTEVSFNTPDQLTVITSAVTSINPPGAVSGGSITGTGTVTSRGVVWGATSNPTMENNSRTIDGSGQGSFTSSIGGLTWNRTYYVRAYAVSAGGVTYGNQVTFTTPVFVATSLTTTAASSITKTSATAGGSVTGSTLITSRGVCWSTSSAPTTSNSKTIDGSGSGSFTSAITGLTPGTLYYFRAYAIDVNGTTTYGPLLTFSTQADFTLTTTAATFITATSAVAGGTITGTANLQERGVCWSTSPNPSTGNSRINASAPTVTYTAQLNGLLGGTTYYIRAYAITTGGTTVYGNELSFTTTAAAVVTTTTPTSITISSALTGGTISSTQTITQRGVVWGTAPNPVKGVQASLNSGSGTGTFTLNVTGLSANVTYYIRAYAVTSTGQTVYGDQKVFTTLP
ncbi:hypothetical protein KK083_27855 [Fulvivirgaceae bacterium PWU4]|uniref:Fibronectin type-III domain-containing protein n=1 Tax=Chryseosolibacter histidini TaxID=2782349 RepID=A0AAP2DTL4_9BACT|nr:hypothetical protein [Chryseosolibacter histidini]MBT1700737.1 hypothetical protein [Chryseosolibacter histidini]